MGPGKWLVVVVMGCMNLSPNSGIVVLPDARKVVKMNVGVVADVLTEGLHQDMKS